MSVYEEIARKLQARFSHAKVEFEGESILYDNAVFYRITIKMGEPFTGNMLSEIRVVAREYNFAFLDFITVCRNGNIVVDFWIIPLRQQNKPKVANV